MAKDKETYGVKELSDEVGMEPRLVRIRLRAFKDVQPKAVAGAKRPVYQFSKGEFVALIKRIKDAPVRPRGRPAAKVTDGETAKPAKAKIAKAEGTAVKSKVAPKSKS